MCLQPQASTVDNNLLNTMVVGDHVHVGICLAAAANLKLVKRVAVDRSHLCAGQVICVHMQLLRISVGRVEWRFISQTAVPCLACSVLQQRNQKACVPSGGKPKNDLFGMTTFCTAVALGSTTASRHKSLALDAYYCCVQLSG
jgi:hypothetical protein